MSKHPSLPKTLTPEMLGQWIVENAVETLDHVEKIDLDEEQVHELEKKSSLASRAIDRLEEIKKTFMDVLKEGTPDREMPFDVSVPPTAGLKILKANRAFADKQLEQGYREEITTLYMIPYPEDSLMVAVDITGEEWPDFGKQMSIEQINQHKPMLKTDKKKGHLGVDLSNKSEVILNKNKDQASFLEEEEETTTDLDL